MTAPDDYARETALRRRILPYGFPLLDADPPAALEAMPAPDAATWEGLSAAVALMTARVDGIHLAHADIADVPPGAVLAALAVIAVALLRQELGKKAGRALLRSIGLDAAREAAERPAT